jgi:HCOMODA/2-hydroxy-3-carboxy-muconic semialdehyde decarboxylase
VSAIDIAIIDLVIANKALARCGAVDAYGHASVRHPTDPSRFLLSRSRSPELVERDDIMQFDLDGTVVGSDNRPPYLERFLHAAIYSARPDVHAVAHGHPRVVLPFSISGVKLRPLFFTANEIGADIPVWDCRDNFGDTNMLIVNLQQGRDLAARLGAHRVVLLRGHGFVGAARSAMQLVRLANALLDNAALQIEAMHFGPLVEMSPGELAARDETLADDESPAILRGWEYEAIRAGCQELLHERAELVKQLSPSSTRR